VTRTFAAHATIDAGANGVLSRMDRSKAAPFPTRLRLIFHDDPQTTFQALWAELACTPFDRLTQ
jgi:hypothetical protein